MKDRVKELLFESLNEVFELRPQTYFVVFLSSLLSIFPLFHFLILAASLAVCGLTIYDFWKEEQKKHGIGGKEDV